MKKPSEGKSSRLIFTNALPDGRATAPLIADEDVRAPSYVPVSQLPMYSSCSEVSVSIDNPKARNFKLAIS